MKENPLRRTLRVAAFVLLAASESDSNPTEADPGPVTDARGSVPVTDNASAVVANAEVVQTGDAQAARTTISGAASAYPFTSSVCRARERSCVTLL
ncbi:MAG TPA: hypothetical protein VD948_06735 [Rhodothermales bacterium]|nr:hypothetical protein [Rhodothermales bacterium]